MNFIWLSGFTEIHHSKKAFMATKNHLKKIRESLLMSKAEFARKAWISPLTIDRIEKGMLCRMETKRKIILGLGKDFSERGEIFFHEH
jgi:DNA-binding XRE family transcriptional regulator